MRQVVVLVVRKIIFAILPVVLCISVSGCTSYEQAREEAIQRFDQCQTAMEEVLRDHLYVLQENTSANENPEDSSYYVRNYSVTMDEHTELSIILKSNLSGTTGNQYRASATLTHRFREENDLPPEKCAGLFSQIVQAIGSPLLDEELCIQFLQDCQLGESTMKNGQLQEKSYSPQEDQDFLYYYSDQSYYWQLSYEWQLPETVEPSESP